MESTSEKIKLILSDALQPEHIEILDDSQAHASHPGAASGGGHFYLSIVADQFEGKSRIQRHQLIYQTLGEMMKQEIHALSIKAFSPKENHK